MTNSADWCMIGIKGEIVVMNNNYEYDYHDLVEDTDFIDDDTYYNNGIDEPWMDTDEDSTINGNVWENYYHNLTDELDD